jgi:hypothetical protein
MVVSIFTMNLSYPDAAKSLSVLVLCCGFLELFWIQVVYGRFPILREDEERRGRGKVKLAPSNTDYGRPSSGPDDDSQLSRHGEGWRAELSTWSEFAHMPVFFGEPLVAGDEWTTLIGQLLLLRLSAGSALCISVRRRALGASVFVG